MIGDLVALDDRVQGRLLNWKFEQADVAMAAQLNAGEVIPEDWEVATIRALSFTFGNPGFFYGSMADIIRAAVWGLGVVDD